MVTLPAHAFCRETYCRPEVRPCANEDNGPSARSDTTDDLGGATKKGEGMVEVDDGDARTDTVGVRHEVGVHACFRVTEVGSRRDEGGESDVSGCYGSVEGMMRLESVFSRLG